MLLIIAMACVFGVDLVIRYVGRKRRIPQPHEVREDLIAWNHYLELLAVRRVPLFARLHRTLDNAGLHHVALWQLLAAMIAFAVIGRSIGDSIFVGFLPSLGCAIALALIPIVAVLRTRARRQERILDQLDHICSNVINRCLTGSQVSDALNVVVSEGRYERGGKTLEPTLPAPLGPELVTLYRDVFMNAMGFAEACEASARRIMHPVYANFMTELVVASTSQSPAQSLTDFRVTLEADRQLERFVTEEFSPWIAQAALVPLVGTGVLIATRFTMPNAQAVLSHPLGQIGFLIGWALALANILFMRSQARFEAVLVGAEF